MHQGVYPSVNGAIPPISARLLVISGSYHSSLSELFNACGLRTAEPLAARSGQLEKMKNELNFSFLFPFSIIPRFLLLYPPTLAGSLIFSFLRAFAAFTAMR